MTGSELILASASVVRREMLTEAGLRFRVVPSPFDEEAHKDALANLSPAEQGLALARGKAQAVSALYPQAYVIGADQVCALGDRIFGKPGTPELAALHLAALQGREHTQYSAASLWHDGHEYWHEVEVVRLWMRSLSQAEIEAYIITDQPFAACGAYCYEKTGRTLFEQVEGSVHAIKGLPLNGLLAALERNTTYP